MTPNEQPINNNNNIYQVKNGDIKMSDNTEFIVKHKGKRYDIKPFLRNHPGGINFVQPYQNKNITSKLNEHSPSAKYLLKEYQVGGREMTQTLSESKTVLRTKLENGHAAGDGVRSIQEEDEEISDDEEDLEVY